MENLKVIKTKDEHAAALAELGNLLQNDPQPGTAEGNRLELLGLLVEQFENEHVAQLPTDPVDAILFRIEQQHLAHRDLIPFLGSRSKVSEILSRKRPLTLNMIRALHEGLGIPAEILITAETAKTPDRETTADYPIAEMIRRGWISSANALEAFLQRHTPQAQAGTFFRRGQHIRSARGMHRAALRAWTARVTAVGAELALKGTFDLEHFKRNLTSLPKLSVHDDGPQRVVDVLSGLGIAVVIEPHLPRTLVDGAAVLTLRERPIIGLSLRYDRLDNFWFTIMHELSHVALHHNEGVDFIDDLDVDSKDRFEVAADELATELLIPNTIWAKSPATSTRSEAAADWVAKRAQVNPAIIAGRMRRHWKSYRMFNHLVGQGEVRKHFTEVKWND